MHPYRDYFWRKTPFLKLLLPFIVGILIQWQFSLAVTVGWLVFFSGLLLFTLFILLPFFKKYKYGYLPGIAASFIFMGLGILFTWHQDVRHDERWFGNHYTKQDGVVVSLAEPLSEKAKTYKANASVSYLVTGDCTIAATGTIILYFQKSESDTMPGYLQQLGYGSRIIFTKPLQDIINSGNPGGFNYQRYSLFQGITHQVFLKPGEFEILPGKTTSWINSAIFSSRKRILSTLRKNISGEKELGLAEALLIGYKDDLDQSLVQSYTNTGVVHIIAISGLHLGLVYWLLLVLLKPLKRRAKTKWLVPFIIIGGLWAFSLLAGAQPSVLRSALMFSCIVLGESLSRKVSIYNTLSISAFLLLCYNPFWLWDVGFQLSYAAVLSIVIFLQPVYNLLYIPNKLLDMTWKLNAVSIAAQLLTIPISIYHFHQFPNYFLLTNFVAVPLSSLVVLGEIVLCTIASIPAVATVVGKLLSWLIWLMNTYIERVQLIPFSLWDGLQVSLLQAIFLLLFTAGIAYWLMNRSPKALLAALVVLLAFSGTRAIDILQARRQEKIIVYNVPQKKAIDFISGMNYVFLGDSDLQEDGFARNFHLKPSRILNRVEQTEKMEGLLIKEECISFQDKKILLLDHSTGFTSSGSKPVIDLLVISHNPTLYISQLAAALQLRQVVFDGSVPAWKAKHWKADCDSLHIPWHDVTDKGAFVMNLN